MFWLVFILLFSSTFSDDHVDDNHRIDCEPGRDKGNDYCTKIGCVEDPSHGNNAPFCYFPPKTGYIATNLSTPNAADDKQLLLKKDSGSVKNPFGTDFENLDFSWSELGSAVYLKISPTGVKRYRPPVPLAETSPINSNEKLIVQSFDDGVWYFNVVRQSTGTQIWNTSIGGLLFADQYIQISTIVPTDRIYGFGENIHGSLKHDFSQYKTYSMFARDQAPDSGNPNVGKNLYGVHNFYLGVESDGKAHGVFFFNSNPQEVTVGGSAITYRTIGGQIEFFFFPGPSPEDVIKQYEQLIGKPMLPPYWALGYQLCRYGYSGTKEIRDTVNRMRAAGIPQDVQFSDIDYLDDKEDFSYDHTNFKDLPQLAQDLHNNYSMHLTLIFDPAIEVDYSPMTRAIQQNAKFIEWPRPDLVPTDTQNLYPLIKNTSIMLGKVWPERNVAFPDFLDPQGKTQNWWISEFSRFHDQVAFDGAWIDMNEPSNFGTTSKSLNGKDNVPALKCPMSGADSYYDKPPYETQAAFYYGNDGHLYSKTLCMLGTMGRNSTVLYDSKSIYGWSESVSTHQAIQNATGKRGIVISRSTFPSSGKYTGHWLGDNTARWEDLRTSVIGAQEFNMFGIPYVGSDICGFIGKTTEELCLRWQQMGAFHSFSRNHNDKGNPPQDPAQWTTVSNAARRANLFRYHYLPYLYSLHFKASLEGGTVVRPVFFEFPNDANAHKISYQFLWGPSMMIIPVVEEGTTTVQAYLPTAAIWYALYNSYYGTIVPSGNTFLLAGWDSMIPIFIRGGSILPRQAPALTTVLARKNRFELVMGLINDENGNRVANGELYWDDGDSIYPENLMNHNFYRFEFSFTATAKNAKLTITATKSANNLPLPYLENIEIFGYPYTPDFTTAAVNGNPVNISSTSTYAQFTKNVNITGTDLVNLNSGGPTWTFTFSNK